MKLLKNLGSVCLILLISACKSDDDAVSGIPGGIDVATLLTSGKWYQESVTPGSFTDCEKNTSVEFSASGVVFIESFDDDSGPCESQGLEEAVYTLVNNRDIIITADTDILSAVIETITADLLIVTTNEGDTITFDKVQG